MEYVRVGEQLLVSRETGEALVGGLESAEKLISQVRERLRFAGETLPLSVRSDLDGLIHQAIDELFAASGHLDKLPEAPETPICDAPKSTSVEETSTPVVYQATEAPLAELVRETPVEYEVAEHAEPVSSCNYEPVLARILETLAATNEPQASRELFNFATVIDPNLIRSEFTSALESHQALSVFFLDSLTRVVGLREWGGNHYLKPVRERWGTMRKQKAEALQKLADPIRHALYLVAIEKSDAYLQSVLRQANPALQSFDDATSTPRTLKEWQRSLAIQIKDVQLLGQLNITREQHSDLSELIRDTLRSQGPAEGVALLEGNVPLALGVFLVFHGIFNYFSNTYWPQVCRSIDLPYDNNTSRLGQAFEYALRRHGLPLMEDLQGKRYLRRIIGHAGIPDENLPELFRAIILPSIVQSELQHLSLAELSDFLETKEQGVSQALSWFLQAGGKFAEDILERSRDMAREALRGAELNSEDYGLPERFAVGLRRALEEKASAAESVRSPIVPRPFLSFDPWAEGLRVEFPVCQAEAIGSGPQEAVWQVSYGDQVLSQRERLSRQGRFVEVPAQFFFLPGPAREYRCKLTINGQAQISVSLDGLSTDRPMLLFATRTGKLLGKRIADRQVWVLYPGGSLLVDGYQPQILEEFPRLSGAWRSYQACWLELADAKVLQLQNPAYAVRLSPEVPIRLLGSEVISEFGAESGVAVFAESLPTLVIGLPNPSGWSLQVLSDCVSERFSSEQLAIAGKPVEGQFHLDLEKLVPSAQAGEYRVVLRGQLGQDSRRVFRFVPRLRIETALDRSGELVVEVPVGSTVRQENTSCTAVKKDPHSWIYRLEFSAGRSHIAATVEYARCGTAPYALPLQIINPRPCWSLTGLSHSSALHWTDRRLEVPLHILEESQSPELLLQVPEEASVQLFLYESDQRIGQCSPALQLHPERSRGRGRFELAPFLDSLRASQQAICHLQLAIQMAGKNIAQQALSVTRDWQVHGLEVSWHSLASGHALHILWQQDFPARHRCVRLWNLCRPWSEPQVFEIPDENVQHLSLTLDEGLLEPGFYQAELFIQDPWVQTALTPSRPPRSLPNCAVFAVCPDELLEFQRNLPVSGLGCMQGFLLDLEDKRPSHKALFPLPSSLQDPELPDFIRAIIVLSQDDRQSDSEVLVAVEQYFAGVLKDRLDSLLRILPELLNGADQGSLTSWLLRIRLTVEPLNLRPDDLSSSEREMLWEAWSPLGAMVELRCPSNASVSRAARYLGTHWTSLRGARDLPDWGACPGQEVDRDSRALKQMWQFLDVTPSGPLDSASLQKAYFQTFLGLHQRGARGRARQWVAKESAALEQALARLTTQGTLPSGAQNALLRRHPKTDRGDMKEPLTQLPFVVGAVAVVQRLRTLDPKNCHYPKEQLLQQVLACHEFAPELFDRDMCQVEVAFTEIAEDLENDDFGA